MRRALLCSMSVPWPERPLVGSYHVDQALGMREIGVEMGLFSPAPCLPDCLAAMHRRFRGHLARPRSYRVRGVQIRSPRVPFFFSPTARRYGARLAPRALATWARTALRGAMRREIERSRPDFLLAHAIMPWGDVVAEAAEAAALPFAFVEHSAEDVLRLRSGTRLARFYRDAARRARAVFAVGPAMVEHLQGELGLENAVLLPNGTDLLEAAASRPNELGTDLMVLSAGHYYRRKGYEVLVEGFSRVAHRHPRARLDIVTEVPPSLRRLVERRGLRGRVHLHEPMPSTTLRQWMAWADLFALASWSEAFGIVGLEALAARTPVLFTRDSGLARMIPSIDTHHDGVGWVVEPRCAASVAAALEQALTDRERLARMGRAGRSFVAGRFTWAGNARTILETLDGAAKGAR